MSLRLYYFYYDYDYNIEYIPYVVEEKRREENSACDVENMKLTHHTTTPAPTV